LEILRWIVNMVIIFAAAVVVHELGHLAAAKLVGMRVLEFGIGFPPRLWRFARRGGTDYTINAVPLGGLCRIAGMDPEETDIPGGFYTKPYWARAVVLLAGPLMNVVLGVAVFVAMGPTLGIPTDKGAIVGAVAHGSEAERMGLAPKDRIVGLNGRPVKYMDLIDHIHSHPGTPVTLTVLRGKKTLALTGTPQAEKDGGKKIGRLGFTTAANIEVAKIPYAQAPREGLYRSWDMLRDLARGLAQRTVFRQAGGPVAIGEVTYQATKEGTVWVVFVLAVLCVNLGFVNLLPIPVLDGGHLVLIPIDIVHRAIRRRGLSPQTIMRIQLTGLALIVAIMFALTFRDIRRIMGG
jgi:regulator of sigma E protease